MNPYRSLALVFGALWLLLVAPTAAADTWGGGPPDEGYKADDIAHTYCFGSGFDLALQNNAAYAMGTSLDATDIEDSYSGSCTAGIDVKWLDANLSAGKRGAYSCTSLTGSICYASNATLDPEEINQGSNDEDDTTKTACQEAGHSVGLQHGDNKTDCMINGEIPSTSFQWRSFNDHHKLDHINPYYN